MNPKLFAPPAPRNATLPARDLGRVIAVQDDRITSLVRIPVNGAVTCDCAEFAATRAACPHMAAAARFVAAGAA